MQHPLNQKSFPSLHHIWLRQKSWNGMTPKIWGLRRSSICLLHLFNEDFLIICKNISNLTHLLFSLMNCVLWHTLEPCAFISDYHLVIFSIRTGKAKNDLYLTHVHYYFDENDESYYSWSFWLLYLLCPIFVVDTHFSKIKSLSLIVPSSDACLLLMFWTNWCWCSIGANYTFVCPWSFLAAHLVLDYVLHLIMKQLCWHSLFFIFHLLHLLKCKNLASLSIF